MNQEQYDNIRPFNDQEAAEALSRISKNPLLKDIHDFIFKGGDFEQFKLLLASMKGVDDFQEKIMAKVVANIVNGTSKGLSYDGLDNIKSDKKYLFVSNHRDIILDPAIIQLIFYSNGLTATEIAVGDNLVKAPFIEDLIRSNRMIKVSRGGTPRDLYQASVILSEYIRQQISSDKSFIWIAQRNGRTKDGIDKTSQGLLKMFDMSGSRDFVESFSELNILPVSISYEYESCDFLKAKELYYTRRGKYIKSENEDTNSMITGMTQNKGRIYYYFGNPISKNELEFCANLDKNERYKSLAELMDKKIMSNYKLWSNNYIAYDILSNTLLYLDKYSVEEKDAFVEYMNKGLSAICKMDSNIDISELKEIFLSIYANPINSLA